MEVIVLIAGVVDPKWRLERLGLRNGTEQPDESGLPRRLSPFDEAALETALKLQEADPSVRVTVAVPGDAGSDVLLRAAMALRPHRAFRFDTAGAPPWDPFAMARMLGAAVDAAGLPDLVLAGREFGDGDDGVLLPLLAEMRGWSFCGQAHGLALADGAMVARRMRGPREEVIRLPSPALVSVTNDRSNRLRHPLMKNVVLTRRAAIEVVAMPCDEKGRTLHACSLTVVPPAQRGAGSCRMLEGPLDAQVAEFAAYLRGWRDGAVR
jgi:electron transfer flavoprotein beta subunit